MWMIDISLDVTPERMAARPAHRELLTRLHAEGVVRMAGPFADDAGAMIILDVPDRAAVEAFLAADPYYAAAGVTVANIREWNPFVQ